MREREKGEKESWPWCDDDGGHRVWDLKRRGKNERDRRKKERKRNNVRKKERREMK